MPLNRHDWAAIYAKLAFIAMLKRALVECGVISCEILFAKNSLVPGGFWALPRRSPDMRRRVARLL